MAAATTIIGGLGLAKGIYDSASGSKRKNQYQDELNSYQRQTLDNVYKNMPISTIGTDIMREETSKNMATSMNSIGRAGTRAIIGATPKLVADRNTVNRTIQKDIDDQVIKRNYAIASDDARIQQMQEQREYQDLAGLGNAIDTARQDTNMGMNTILNSGMYLASNFGKGTSTDTDSADGTFKAQRLPSSIGWTSNYKF